MISPLNLNDALKLYSLLGEYLPPISEEEINNVDSYFNFIGKIVRNIKDSGNNRVYIESIALMTKVEVENLLHLSSEEILSLFIDGLSGNRIAGLKLFCESIGFNHA